MSDEDRRALLDAAAQRMADDAMAKYEARYKKVEALWDRIIAGEAGPPLRVRMPDRG